FVMAWDKRQIPDDKAPRTLAEFWDTDRFKGKRSLYAGISDGSTLEMALLADGVPLNQIYPLDVDRALRSLERLGRAHIIWHNTNAEPIQQLTSGAVALANCFNGRVIAANRSGAQLGFTPAYSAVSGNPYCVIASSANKKEAFEYLNYLLNTPKADAEYMQLTNYAIPNTQALKLVPSEILDILPTRAKLRDRAFLKDDAWWAATGSAMADVVERGKFACHIVGLVVTGGGGRYQADPLGDGGNGRQERQWLEIGHVLRPAAQGLEI